MANTGNDYWLNAPTYAPLEPVTSGLPKQRNSRLSDLLGSPRKEATFEDNLAKIRRSVGDEPDGHSSDDMAVGTLGVIPEGD